MPHTLDTVSPQTGDLSPTTEEEISEAMPEPKFGINVPDAPACAQAASLAGMLLRITRQPTWTALARAIDDGDEDTLVRLADFELTEDQQTLLDTWATVIEVAVAEPGSTVCVCVDCGDWSVVGSRNVPSTCRTTSRCVGKVVKAPRATRKPLTPPPPSDDPRPDDLPEQTPPDEALAAVIPLFGPGKPAAAQPFVGHGVQMSDFNHTNGADSGGSDEAWTVDPDETFGDIDEDGPDPRLRADDETVEAGDFGL